MNRRLEKILKDFPLREKKLWPFFVLFFVFFLFLLNWPRLYWIFNQKAVYGELKTVLEEQRKELDREPAPLPSPTETSLPEAEYTEKENSLEIPKIGILVPLVFPNGSQEADLQAALKTGVIHFPDSALPGERGVVIILGHSAPPNWPRINYDWVFNEIDKLESGDEIILHFNHRKYVYKTAAGKILERGGEIPAEWFSDGKSSLVLLSCWPPGKDYKRYGVAAVLK